MKGSKRSFDYIPVLELSASHEPAHPGAALAAPDRRDGSVYVYDDGLKLATEVSMVTGRPLLLRGKPGSGKSSFAAYVARSLGWCYYDQVITARTRAQDLLWTFDSVRRLADAQVSSRGGTKLYDYDYVEPGVLWWVFDRDLANRRGAPPERLPALPALHPNEEENATRSPDHAVVLLDEIDKADPDVPNDLLVPLGSLEFRVEETGTVVRRPVPSIDAPKSYVSPLLVVITTNEERDLPDAFLRRCVVYELLPPDADRLVEIAGAHFGDVEGKLAGKDLELCRELARIVVRLRKEAAELALRGPSTAEFLDAVRACRSLGVAVGSETWKKVESVVLRKRSEPSEDEISAWKEEG